jgi:hypothetical protein
MQNLAEMVYAISYPYRWEKNVKQNPAPGIFSSGLRMFHDFSHDENMLMYHSPWFWKRVAKAWEDKNIEELGEQNVLAAVFGDPVNTIDLLRTTIADSGLRLLAKGYSWWTSTSNKLSLYQYTYMNGEGNESNMHKEIYTEVKKDYKDLVSPINIYDKDGGFGEDHHPGIMSMEFFGDGLPHYVIRHATGKELAGFKPDVNATMCTEGNGLTDIYTYNQYYNIEASDKLPPEVINPKRGDVIGKNGLFYDSPNRARQDHTEPVAVVIYRGTEIDADDSGDYNGLAMSMTLADNSSVSWCDNTNYICIENTKGMESEWRKSLDGYFQTEKLVKDAHNHQAAKMAYNYKSVNGFNPKDFGFTDWFLPTAGQIIMCVENLGANVVLKNETESCIYEIQDNMVQLYNGFYGRISNQGVQDMDCTFWTSTESTEENAVTANMSPDGSGSLNTIKKDSKMKVRPFFAF